jgi:hypothetical protein
MACDQTAMGLPPVTSAVETSLGIKLFLKHVPLFGNLLVQMLLLAFLLE